MSSTVFLSLDDIYCTNNEKRPLRRCSTGASIRNQILHQSRFWRQSLYFNFWLFKHDNVLRYDSLKIVNYQNVPTVILYAFFFLSDTNVNVQWATKDFTVMKHQMSVGQIRVLMEACAKTNTLILNAPAN